VDKFEEFAAGTRHYGTPIRPYAVDAALLRPTEATGGLTHS
jgi:hypothetical protein